MAVNNSYYNMLHLPAFIPCDPALWFSLIEAIFSTAGVVDDSNKYHHVVCSLPPHEAIEMRDILLNPSEDNKYVTLKTAIIKRLLSQEAMGDRKPSQFLLHLKILAGSAVPDAELRTLWIERLPRPMQMILALATQPEQTLEKVAYVADVIADNTVQTATIATTEDPVKVLQREIAALEQQLKALSINISARRRGRSRSRSRQRSRPRSRDNSATRMCWYHGKYGSKAHKCLPPCTY
ncbi:uncharacterized protein LOC134671620 [Cydia fagiglandana]|uniref:uncharacterized protein LOC134671620 n=1 Tax=Cydia fagiglandana TaxID=1458189 RepID=UPI002FEE40A7